MGSAVWGQNRLPDVIASGYTGSVPHRAGDDVQARIIERFLDPMAEAEFTLFTGKYHGRIDLSDPEQFEQVRRVAEACEARGLAFVPYLMRYPWTNPPRRADRHADYPPVVTRSGEVLDDEFALANEATWRMMSHGVFEFARASLELPIAAVGFDIERICDRRIRTISYDDGAWPDFAAEHGLDQSLPAEARGKMVEEAGLVSVYEAWYQARWDDIVRRWVADIHAINPDLSIAIMPYRTHWMGRPFLRHAGTARAPAIIDHWGMYNGGGLTERQVELGDTIRALNPHIRYVNWFRPDSYRPEDLRVQAYHTLRQLDGYGLWHLGQITEAEDTLVYWSALGDANRLAQQALAAGRSEPSIPFESVTPLVAVLPEDLSPVTGSYRPRGDGTGDPVWLPMRGLQTFLVQVEAGQELTMDLRHLAGDSRPLALNYRVLAPEGELLFEDSVMPGQTDQRALTVPYTGVYTVYVTGGAGGQAWYAVRIHNPWFAVPFDSGVGRPYFFYHHLQERRNGHYPLTVWLQRSAPHGPAALRVATGSTTIEVRIGDGPWQLIHHRTADLPLPEHDQPIPVTFRAPGEELPERRPWRTHPDIDQPIYVQDIRLTVEGPVVPYLWVSPERMLYPDGP